MTTNQATTNHLAELSSLRDRLKAELCLLDDLIVHLSLDAAATTREIAMFELGQRLGATKLSRLLGCSRNHAIKHLETTFGENVRTESNGSRWVPRSVVEEWLSQGGASTSRVHNAPKRAPRGRRTQCDRCAEQSVAVIAIGEGQSALSLEFCEHHLAPFADQLAARGHQVLFHK